MANQPHLFKQKPGIYKISSIISNKIYIGSSVNISIRITSHKNCLFNNKHANQHLQHSYNKYGINNFKYEVIEYCSEDKLLEREEFWINFLKSNESKIGYNIQSYYRGRKKHSEETKKKISASHSGKKRIITQKMLDASKLRGLKRRGISPSKKTIAKIRKAKTGVKREPFSKEWKQNLGESRAKLYIDIFKDNILIISNISVKKASILLKRCPETIRQALKNNYKVNNHIVCQHIDECQAIIDSVQPIKTKQGELF